MNIIVALVMSLIAPGSGQAYNGQRAKAFVFGGVSVFVPTLILPLILRTSQNGAEWGMNFFGLAYPVITLMAIVDAAGEAVRIRRGSVKTEGGGWQIGLICLVAILVLRFGIKLSGIPLKIAGMG